ncbi:MAG TPA: thioredoxin [Gaiellaceae bacterium]|nr:thioredoxin [Gaiellaceae bacterium]
MDNVITLTSENFDEKVVRSGTPVLVDYWAPWCGPCRAVSPLVEEIAGERAGNLVVGKVNVDEEPDLAVRAGVQGIPTLVLYQDGVPVRQTVGALPKRKIEKSLGLRNLGGAA